MQRNYVKLEKAMSTLGYFTKRGWTVRFILTVYVQRETTRENNIHIFYRVMFFLLYGEKSKQANREHINPA